jgi:hypothetical protein
MPGKARIRTDPNAVGNGQEREPSFARTSVNEFTAISERWGYWSDGCGELLPFCPECSGREFAHDAPASGLVPLGHRRDAS